MLSALLVKAASQRQHVYASIYA